MKKIIFAIISFLFINSLFSQKVEEFEFLKLENNDINIYDLQYNEDTKTYVYSEYDEEGKYYLISNKGNSRRYTYISIYNIQFDKNGNYYSVTYNYDNQTDVTKYYFLINGKEVLEFDFISYSLSKYGDVIYFIAKEGNSSFLVSYNTKTNKFNYGKKYNNIYLSKIDEDYVYEPEYELGFTKNGEPYYIAENEGRTFLVIGNEEQKKYNSIREYLTYEDLKGNICYHAIVNEGSNQYGFLVQGKKEYKKFNATLGPIIFKPDNTPIYIGSTDSKNEYNSQFIIEGEKPGKVYNGYIYNLTFTPTDKIAYIATDTTPDGKSYARVVIDGKENKKYDNVYRLNFLQDGTPVYIGTKEDKEILIIGNVEHTYNYSSILNICITPKNEIAFLGVIYNNENEAEDNFYVHIGDKKLGPYASIPYSYMEGMVDFIVFNEKGNYAFVMMDSSAKHTIVSDYFNCDYFDSIWNLEVYKNDFFYLGNKTTSDSKNSFKLYKNSKAITGSYDQISNFKLNKKDGTISFIGLKGNTVYYVRVSL